MSAGDDATAVAVGPEQDPHDPRLVRGAPQPLLAFNAAGVLAPADVHVAATLGQLTGCDDAAALLAAALAVRAPRFGHVCVDLASVRTTITTEDESSDALEALPWPTDVTTWIENLRDSGLCAEPEGPAARPLRLDGTRCYLDRYWRYERRVADDLARRSAETAAEVDVNVLRDGLDRLFPREARAQPSLFDRLPARESGEPDRQRLAAAVAVLRRLAVVAGGPGTGKTTTITHLLALLDEQADAAGARPPRIAVAAPTGKAADRLEEAIRGDAGGLPVHPSVRARLLGLDASTIHRLLGTHPGNATRFRHDRTNPLPHDVVVVDETSMVSLALMAKLLEAVRPDARIVLVGDPEQLASVEAGAVLGDIVGAAGSRLRMSPTVRQRVEAATGEAVPATDRSAGATIGDGIVVLTRVHRFRGDSRIAELASAIQAGDTDATLRTLAAKGDEVAWLEASPDAAPGDAAFAPVRAAVAETQREVLAAARRADAAGALDAFGKLRILCAHRGGPSGALAWNDAVERALGEAVDGFDAGDTWYLARPVLVTENDYQLNVFNGDVGVTIAGHDGGLDVAFAGRDGPRRLSPVRLEAVETVYAMTIHKSQGSQFHSVVVVLPDETSPVLTRELLYTAVTRARRSVRLVASEAAVRAAVERPIQRASGLREALWTPTPATGT